MKLLLDSNAYTAIARGESEALAIVRDADQLLISVVVIGELRYGFQYGTQVKRNETALAEFIRRPFVIMVPVSDVTADTYSRISVSLTRK